MEVKLNCLQLDRLVASSYNFRIALLILLGKKAKGYITVCMAKTEIWDTQNQNMFLFLKKPIYECFFPSSSDCEDLCK